jgi:hypothetical protein
MSIQYATFLNISILELSSGGFIGTLLWMNLIMSLPSCSTAMSPTLPTNHVAKLLHLIFLCFVCKDTSSCAVPFYLSSESRPISGEVTQAWENKWINQSLLPPSGLQSHPNYIHTSLVSTHVVSESKGMLYMPALYVYLNTIAVMASTLAFICYGGSYLLEAVQSLCQGGKSCAKSSG